MYLAEMFKKEIIRRWSGAKVTDDLTSIYSHQKHQKNQRLNASQLHRELSFPSLFSLPLMWQGTHSLHLRVGLLEFFLFSSLLLFLSFLVFLWHMFILQHCKFLNRPPVFDRAWCSLSRMIGHEARTDHLSGQCGDVLQTLGTYVFFKK